jgi:hypothetical protein
MITVDDIRQAYPNPEQLSSAAVSGAGYCVGGALCLYLERQGVLTYRPDVLAGDDPAAKDERDRDLRFPQDRLLAAALQRANPRLSEASALVGAGRITSANDRGQFDLAWERLREALTADS